MKERSSIFSILRRNFLLMLAIAGITWAIIFSFATGTEQSSPSSRLNAPSIAPFEKNIAGIGFVEASSRNINIGAFTPGIVNQVLVKEGDKIKVGDPLFVIDQRSAEAELANRQNALEVAENMLELAKVALKDAKDLLKRAEGLKSGRSISTEELQRRHFGVEKAEADIKVKESMIEQRRSEVDLARVALDKTTIRSPIDGTVLKVRITPGEFISGNEQDIDSPMLIGSTDKLHVRVQIDESDAWRFSDKASAYAFLRGNNTIKLPLIFLRTEPYAIAKSNISGGGNELVDTRVIELIYQIDSETDNIYIGQHLDVFIESDENP